MRLVKYRFSSFARFLKVSCDCIPDTAKASAKFVFFVLNQNGTGLRLRPETVDIYSEAKKLTKIKKFGASKFIRRAVKNAAVRTPGMPRKMASCPFWPSNRTRKASLERKFSRRSRF